MRELFRSLLRRGSPRFFLILSLGILLSFSLSSVRNFTTADEHFWLPNYGTERLQDYWRAVAKGDWEDTRINDKPGVTLAFFSGVALPFAHDLIARQIVFSDKTVTVFDPEVTRRLNFLFRAPLVLFIAGFFFYFYWILHRLTGDRHIATWAVILMMLSPVLLGISQIVNPDTLFFVFGTATLFTFLAYLKHEEQALMWLTTLFFGLSLASKYVSVIFIPFLFFLIGLHLLFHINTYAAAPALLAPRIRRDVRAYATILAGGVLILCVLMPAALVDPLILFESTIGFGGMFPIFLAVLGVVALVLFDTYATGSRLTLTMLRFLGRHRAFLERALFSLLLATTLFVLFNWMLRNSLYDVSHIPFDAKTKASFTTDNPFLHRYLVEFVPLIFSLTPVALLLFIFLLAQGIALVSRYRFLVFALASFILVFYLAVIQQGLLVTTRYSIILFPIVLTLGAIGLAHRPDPGEQNRLARTLPAFLVGTTLLILAIHAANTSLGLLPQAFADTLLAFARDHFTVMLLGLLALTAIAARYLPRYLESFWFLRRSFSLTALLLIAISLPSLALAAPHYFVYVNDFLPKRYLISGSWGYGGYEAAQYLNRKPNAKELTLWTDAHGVCEFFVGRCIHKSKVDTSVYHIDYVLRTLVNQLNPKFPLTIDTPEWEYAIGGRKKNFIRLYRNYAE